MIYSNVSNLSQYLEQHVYLKINKFLQQVNENMEEGRYEIWGDKVFARVMSYDTSLPEECKIEAHNKYIDIQATIIGAEGIGVYERERLSEKGSYQQDNDVIFFEETGAKMIAHTINIPGYFTMLFPEEAHRPQEKIDEINKVKKYVIKVAVK